MRTDEGTRAGWAPMQPEATARIRWRDPDTGAELWLGLRGSASFLDELERAGFLLSRPGPSPTEELPAGPRAA